MNLRDAGQGIPNIAAATVPCDLCGWPMAIPEVRNGYGEIPGLLTCSQCVEDELASRAVGSAA